MPDSKPKKGRMGDGGPGAGRYYSSTRATDADEIWRRLQRQLRALEKPKKPPAEE